MTVAWFPAPPLCMTFVMVTTLFEACCAMVASFHAPDWSTWNLSHCCFPFNWS